MVPVHRSRAPRQGFPIARTITPGVIWVHQNNMLEAPLNAAAIAVTWLLIEGTLEAKLLWSALPVCYCT